ncbi:hypothetical protein ACQ4PT_015015 [Festuca glaucescens]
MRGLRSRILRTLQSAAAQSNALLPSPAAAGAWPPTTEKCHLQEHPASPVAVVPELPTVSEGGCVGGDGHADKENFSPEANPRKAKKMKVSSGDGAAEAGLCYRRPELESVTLFDPDLLAAFRGVVDAYAQALEKTAKRYPAYDDDDIAAALEDGAGIDPLTGLEARCPPGGERAVVLYTTSLRGVRKTFEDCATVRRLLDGLRVAFLERDVSMHAPYRDELRALLLGRDDAGAGSGDAMPLPPRLFVNGRYVGGADEVVALHEQSRLRPMLRRAARRGAGEAACAVCGGAWFVVCGGCSGRHWLYDGGAAAAAVAANRVPCSGCNENGLVPCPLCS